MACPRCGCHMVSRSGEGPWKRSTPLVCTRCNHPLPDRADGALAGGRLGRLLTLLVLLFAGAMVFTLASLQDLRSPPPEPERAEQTDGG